MDHYDRRDTFQSEGSGVGNTHDYDQPFDPYGKLPAIFFCGSSPLLPFQGQRHRDTDTESELDVYGQRYAPSAESLNPGTRMSDISAPTFDYGHGSTREPYPAWTSERQIPLSKEFVHPSLADLCLASIDLLSPERSKIFFST